MQRRRPELAALVVISLIMFGLWGALALADAVADGGGDHVDKVILLSLRTPGRLDDPIGPRWLEEMSRDFTSFGSDGVLTFTVVAAAGYLLLQRKRRSIVLMVAAISGAGALSHFLKLAFHRPRPDLVPPLVYTQSPSFPSGHALLAATTYLTMAAMLARVQGSPAVKIYLMLVATALTVMVGLTRVYLGVHWPTDVVAGWAVGGLWALTCWLVADWLERRGKMDREE